MTLRGESPDTWHSRVVAAPRGPAAGHRRSRRRGSRPGSRGAADPGAGGAGARPGAAGAGTGPGGPGPAGRLGGSGWRRPPPAQLGRATARRRARLAADATSGSATAARWPWHSPWWDRGSDIPPGADTFKKASERPLARGACGRFFRRPLAQPLPEGGRGKARLAVGRGGRSAVPAFTCDAPFPSSGRPLGGRWGAGAARSQRRPLPRLKREAGDPPYAQRSPGGVVAGAPAPA